MSFYATIKGLIKYKTGNDLDEGLKFLENGKWIDRSRNSWISEDGRESGTLEISGLELEIPFNYYRNLANVFYEDKLLKGAEDYFIVYGSTDGCLTGCSLYPGGSKSIELEDWAKENNIDLIRDKSNPEFIDINCQNRLVDIYVKTEWDKGN
jgi:hypothetical protein